MPDCIEWVAGSHQDALESYQKAVSLAPARLIHRVELGRTLDRLGKKEEARQELEVCMVDLMLVCLVSNCLAGYSAAFGTPASAANFPCPW